MANNDDSEKENSNDAPPPFKRRFALQWWPDLFLLSIVVILIGLRVWKHGQQAYEGILGRPLRVGIVSWPGYAGGLVANKGLRPNKDSDFWKDHKLLVELVPIADGSQLLRDFVRGGENGGIDIMWSTVDSLAHQAPTLSKEGLDPRAFLQVDWSRGADAIVARAGIERIEDLRDKTVAVSQTASQWLFEYSLESSSLTDADRRTIRTKRHPTKGSQAAHDQFVDGSVDAAALWEPDVSDALNLRKGSRVLIDTSAAANLIADVMVAKEELIQKRPKVISAFIEGWLSGTTKANGDPMLAVQVLRSEPDLNFSTLSEETTHELLTKTPLATLDDNVEMFGLSGGEVFFDRLFRRASHTFLKAGYIEDEATPERERDVKLLTEIYNARSSATKGCQEFKRSVLPIAFPPGKADLSQQALQVLDDDEVADLLRMYSGVRFCVEASTVAGDDPQNAPATRRAREQAVIEHLVKYYRRPRNQFVSVNGDAQEADNGDKVTRYIRLLLSSPGFRQ